MGGVDFAGTYLDLLGFRRWTRSPSGTRSSISKMYRTRSIVLLILIGLSFDRSVGGATDIQNVGLPTEIAVSANTLSGLVSDDPYERAHAVFDIRDEIRRHPGFRADYAVKLIAQKLSDPSGFPRRAAAESLKELGPLASLAMEPLMENIRNFANWDSSAFAIKALSQLGPADEKIQREIEWYLGATQFTPGRNDAMDSLAGSASVPLQPETIHFIEGLIEAKHDDPLLDQSTLKCLCKLAPRNSVLLGRLEFLSKSDRITDQMLVLECVEENSTSLGQSEAKTLLSPLLGSKVSEISTKATRLLNQQNGGS
jgi:hypothetical protein